MDGQLPTETRTGQKTCKVLLQHLLVSAEARPALCARAPMDREVMGDARSTERIVNIS